MLLAHSGKDPEAAANRRRGGLVLAGVLLASCLLGMSAGTAYLWLAQAPVQVGAYTLVGPRARVNTYVLTSLPVVPIAGVAGNRTGVAGGLPLSVIPAPPVLRATNPTVHLRRLSSPGISPVPVGRRDSTWMTMTSRSIEVTPGSGVVVGTRMWEWGPITVVAGP